MRNSALSVSEVASRMGISPQRVRALINAGRLSADRVGSQYVVDRAALAAYLRNGRPEGRPVAARNAWALLAALGDGLSPIDASERSRYRLRHALKSGGDAVVRMLMRSAPRSDVYAWRVLPSDLAALNNDGRLIKTGLAAGDPGIDIRFHIERDGLDAYIREEDLLALEKELRPERESEEPNLLLRVPRDADWIVRCPRAPSAVAAADLIDHADPRVRRAAHRSLGNLANDD